MDNPTGILRLNHRHELVESWMRRESHVQFGRRVGETDRRKRRNRAPTRPNTLAMLALAVLVILTATNVDAEPADADLITLTVAETRRLLNVFITTHTTDSQHALRWSLWRRKTQARARRSHYQRRSARPPK